MKTTIKLHMANATPSLDQRYISAEEYECECLSAGSTDGTLAGIIDAIDRAELSDDFDRKIAERKKREAHFRERWLASQANRKSRVSEMIEAFAEEEEADRVLYEGAFTKEVGELKAHYANRLKFERRRAAKRRHDSEEQARAELRRSRIEARAASQENAEAEEESSAR